MKIDMNEAYTILKSLSAMESSFLDYSEKGSNFVQMNVYSDYLNSSFIQKNEYWKFYFLQQIPCGRMNSSSVPDRVVHDSSTEPDLGFSVHKLFNFPAGPRHQCDYYTMVYTMEGCCHLNVGDEALDIGSGSFCLIPPNNMYAVSCDADSICLAIDLRMPFINAYYEDVFQYDQRLVRFYQAVITVPEQAAYLLIRTDNSSSITHIVLRIITEYINGERLSNSAMKQLLGLLLIMILRSDSTEITTPVKTNLMEQRYQEIMDYIRAHYQTVTLDEVADAIHFSKQYICRIVKAATGDTFNAVLLRVRLEMVKRYLESTETVLESIAEICGFSSAAYLSKVFKDQYGESPSRYRRRIRNGEKA